MLTLVPDMVAVGRPPVTAASFVQCYLADPSGWHWSTALLNERREIVLKRVLAIIAQPTYPLTETRSVNSGRARWKI